MGLSLQAADCKLTEALTTLGLVDIQVNIHPNTENWLLYFFACGNVMQGHEPGHMEWIVKYNTIFKLWYKLPDHPFVYIIVNELYISFIFRRHNQQNDLQFLDGGKAMYDITFKFSFRCINKGIEGISKRK